MNFRKCKNQMKNQCSAMLTIITITLILGLAPDVGFAEMPMADSKSTPDHDHEMMKNDIAKMKEDLAMIKANLMKQKDDSTKMKMGQKKGMKKKKDSMMGKMPDKMPDKKSTMEEDDDSMGGGMGDM